MGKTKRPMAESHETHGENETPHGGSPAATERIKTGGDKEGKTK
jgi:hypothetical protein